MRSILALEAAALGPYLRVEVDRFGLEEDSAVEEAGSAKSAAKPAAHKAR